MAEGKTKRPPNFAERETFTSRLLSKDAIKSVGNTTYEEIGCVGFQPEFNRLEAVIFIKQPFGFGGPICSAGSTEYVRFFISWDGGGSWEDQGVTSFPTHDIPEAAEQRLEYAATLEIEPRKRFCLVNNLVQARAILSWNLEPPPGDENFAPPWGNVHDTIIQIDPRRLLALKDLVAEAKLEIPDEIAQVLDLEAEFQAPKPQSLSIAQLKQLYADEVVEPHRFGFATAQKLIKDPEFAASLAAGVQGPVGELEIDWSDVLDSLASPDGNTSYEELECVGLNPNTSELIATFRTKRPFGYSGGLCSDGSQEYVTFWGDFNNNGTFETCLGTAQVTVYDFDGDMPEDGIEYAVFLPVNLNPYRQPCQDGPRHAGIRAILSWNTPHPCSGSNDPPFWGNSEDTVIQIPPGPKWDPENPYVPYLYTVCWRNVCTIDQGTGLSTGDRPFGGNLWITGEFPVGPAIPVPNRFRYRVRVRPLPGGSWQTLDNQFDIWITEGSGIGPTSTSEITQQAVGGWYTYQEFGSPISGNWRRVTGPNRALARWKTAGETGRWEIELVGKDTWPSPDVEYPAGVQVCPDGTFRQNVIVKLDNEEPQPTLSITGYERDGTLHTYVEGVDCDSFKVGDIIHGDYEVTDEHFGNLWLRLFPTSPANGVKVNPAHRTYYAPHFVPTTGEAGTWTVNTGAHVDVNGNNVGPMDPCGYVVLLETRDRTIAGCGRGWWNRVSVGFCLEE